jgi:E3 ubiquitin-protein ligase RAD18
MEDLVEAFKNARPEVIEYAKRPVVVEGATSPKRSREESYLEEDEGPSRKRTRQSRRTPSKHKVVVLDSDLDDEDYVPGKIDLCKMG